MTLSNSYLADILVETDMMSRDKSLNLWNLLVHVLLSDIPGEVVELGCHAGLTGVMFQKTMDFFGSTKSLHLYDSFQGLPAPTCKDDRVVFEKGSLSTSEQSVFDNFYRFDVKCPLVHCGWFKDSLPNGLPSKIAFAYLDSDMYESTLGSLQHVYPRMSSSAVGVIDDYYDSDIHPMVESKLSKKQPTRILELTPGVKKACDEFFADKPEKPIVLVSGSETQAFFIKDKKFQ